MSESINEDRFPLWDARPNWLDKDTLWDRIHRRALDEVTGPIVEEMLELTDDFPNEEDRIEAQQAFGQWQRAYVDALRPVTLHWALITAKCEATGCTLPATNMVRGGTRAIHACVGHRIETIHFLANTERHQ